MVPRNLWMSMCLVFASTGARATEHCCKWVEPSASSRLGSLLVVVDDSTSVAKLGLSDRVKRFVDWARKEARRQLGDQVGAEAIRIMRFPQSGDSAAADEVCGDRSIWSVPEAPIPLAGSPRLRSREAVRAFTPLARAFDRALDAAERGALVVFITDGVASAPVCRGGRLGEANPRLPPSLVERYLRVKERVRLVQLPARDAQGEWLHETVPPDYQDLFTVIGVDADDPCMLALDQAEGATLPLVEGCDSDDDSTDHLLSRELEEAPLLGAVRVGDERESYCSGLVVGERAVLTARHCVPATRVRLDRGPSVFEYEVIATHAPDEDRLDSVILELDRALGVPPPRRRRAGDVIPPVGRLRHVGFGRLSAATFLRVGARHIVDVFAAGWGCGTGADALRTGCVPGWELALKGTTGLDTCDGDSGGPLFELLREAPDDAMSGPDAQGRSCARVCEWRAVGLTSRAVAHGIRRCGDGGIYTRLDRLAPWISTTLERMESHDL